MLLWSKQAYKFVSLKGSVLSERWTWVRTPGPSIFPLLQQDVSPTLGVCEIAPLGVFATFRFPPPPLSPGTLCASHFRHPLWPLQAPSVLPPGTLFAPSRYPQFPLQAPSMHPLGTLCAPSRHPLSPLRCFSALHQTPLRCSSQLSRPHPHLNPSFLPNRWYSE